MLIEMQRFIELKEGCFEAREMRESLAFEPMTVNTEDIAWFKRYTPWGHEFCEVHFADRGCSFILDLSYEDMLKLVRPERRNE